MWDFFLVFHYKEPLDSAIGTAVCAAQETGTASVPSEALLQPSHPCAVFNGPMLDVESILLEGWIGIMFLNDFWNRINDFFFCLMY